ncbi:copper resistance CopC family protein [Mycolicibacterium poriferae]|uniref:copper resistance CopC family protein n=1 Tax=Mycolicibacterium poriferae TaxID=39694 RepID=UPI0024BA428A|nr:copper resistance CopC family protein [Mycolicibacterium poriferae]
MTRLLGLAAVAILAFGLSAVALTSAGPAWSHATLVSSSPADGEQVPVPPSRVSATFNEPMQTQFAAMTLIGPDGGQYGAGEPAVDDTVISVAVRPGGPAGDYTANYRATSADGHVVSGSWTFRVLAAAPTTDSPAPTGTPASTDTAAPTDTSGDGGTPVWPFVAAATAVVAAGALWSVRRQS